MSLVIGFTSVFYTLWEVGEPFEVKVYDNGHHVGSHFKRNAVFIQNLSMDLDAAKAKLSGQEFRVDLELRGTGNFSFIESSTVKDFPVDCFSFGMLRGSKFSEATDTWQLLRAYDEEKSPRRRALARRRLIDLGVIVRYDWVTQVYVSTETCPDCEGDGEDPATRNRTDVFPVTCVLCGGSGEHNVYNEVKQKYASLDKIEQLKEQALREELVHKIETWSGHHFTDGEKVELLLKELDDFHFDGKFGRTYVRIYETACGKVVKYLGSSPIGLTSEEVAVIQNERNLRYQELRSAMNKNPCLLTDDQIDERYKKIEDLDQQIKIGKSQRVEWCKVAATIKHGSYKGVNETKLLRMKIVVPKKEKPKK